MHYGFLFHKIVLYVQYMCATVHGRDKDKTIGFSDVCFSELDDEFEKKKENEEKKMTKTYVSQDQRSNRLVTIFWRFSSPFEAWLTHTGDFLVHLRHG